MLLSRLHTPLFKIHLGISPAFEDVVSQQWWKKVASKMVYHEHVRTLNFCLLLFIQILIVHN